MPGKPSLRLYKSVPQIEQKLFSIQLPVAIVLDCLNRVNLSSPRMCLRWVSLTTKLDANILTPRASADSTHTAFREVSSTSAETAPKVATYDAVILRQGVSRRFP